MKCGVLWDSSDTVIFFLERGLQPTLKIPHKSNYQKYYRHNTDGGLFQPQPCRRVEVRLTHITNPFQTQKEKNWFICWKLPWYFPQRRFVHSYVVCWYGYWCFKRRTCKPKGSWSTLLCPSSLSNRLEWTKHGLLIDHFKKLLNYVIKLEALIECSIFLYCVHDLYI